MPSARPSPTLVARAFELQVWPDGAGAFAVGAATPSSSGEVQPRASRPEGGGGQGQGGPGPRRRAAARGPPTPSARAPSAGAREGGPCLPPGRKETPAWWAAASPGRPGHRPALEAAAFALPQVGALSEPVRAAGGYAVVRVLEKKAFDPAAFEGQRPRSRAGLKDQRRQQLFRAYMSQARERYTVNRYFDALQRVVG